ncbi:MAG: heavy metal translocating P-type ATPase [Mailhella sp.]|nr:heavy metal translocating P-type ATPase [Mailhella sp.]
MEKDSARPFGHSLEAFSPEKAAPLTAEPAPEQARAGSGLLTVQCSCGCCGVQESAGHGHGAAPHRHGTPWKKLAVAALLALLSEMAHFAEQGGFLASWEVPGVLPFVFAVAAIALSGVQTFKAGWLSIRRLDLNMAALMSVAVTGAVLIGQFPEAAMVMALFNISEAIEERVLEKARRSIKELLALSPEKATVRQPDGSWKETESRLVPLGALVRVRPGERIALDGIVREGHSAVDQSPITGESMPVEKAQGDAVFAGTINASGSFDFEVTAAASNTALARIIHAVEKAQAGRAPIQRFVDSFARWYTPCIFAASVLLALIPPLFLGAAWLSSIYTALVVLVIGCPCALVISTPVTLVSGLAAATRLGMLVKGGAFLEQGRLLRVLALDKTGTLTCGRPKLTDVLPLAGTEVERSRLLALAASLASRSDHPVSRALAEAHEGVAFAVNGFEAVPGKGIQGQVEGRRLRLGNLRLLQGLLCGEEGEELCRRASELEAKGRTVVALADESRVLALFAVADALRESSVQAVLELRGLGVRTVMLTGDNEAAARAIAEQAGVDEFRARLLPEDKLSVIEALAAEAGSGRGKVGMAGDGINDAPALARADIGFAMAGSGTDTAMETADVAIMDDDLRKLPRFVRLSRRVHGILMQNIALVLGVKALFFGLTLAGHTSMWMAVFADVGAALMVVGNGLRAGRR